MLLKLGNSSLRINRFIKSGLSLIQTASITGRHTRGGPASLPYAFPYQDKKFRWYYEQMYPTVINMCQENARVIVVEGPIGVGKSAFCEALAEEFDMLFIPQPTLDHFYLLPSGYDLRQHDHELPESVRSYDHKNFCLDPYNRKANQFQLKMLYVRFYQYLDALCHLMNTGQGVVLERSYFSDYVFMRAMLDNGYITKRVAEAYDTIKLNTSTHFMLPHLVIYLDIPVPVVQERIKTRNYCYEQNSPALTQNYLESLEKYWKKDYLQKARRSSEILIYDWTDGGDIDVVIDDIEKIDFDTMRGDAKFRSWWMSRKMLARMRYFFTNGGSEYSSYFAYPFYKVEEMCSSPSDLVEMDNLFSKIPECKYDFGYNTAMGDSVFSILFKGNTERHRHPKYHLNFSKIY